MKKIVWIAVLLGMILAGCSGQAGGTGAATQIAPSSTPANFQLATEAANPQAATPTNPSAVEAAAPDLTPEESYQMVAAVHANILQVESWLIQGISANQREAMLTPIVDMSVLPIGDIFGGLTPEPAFAESWQAAKDLHSRFYPQLAAWLAGELDDDAFSELLIAFKTESNQMILTADQIALQEFDIEVAEYQPDYARALTIVFTLSSSSPGLLGGPRLQTGRLAGGPAEENSHLLVKAVSPLVYQFAGADLLMVIGEVENLGDENLELAEIEVRFFDVDNSYIGTMWGTTTSILIEPGKSYPFSVTQVIDGDDTVIREQWFTYEVQVRAHPLSFTPDVYYHDFDMVLLGVTGIGPGEYLITGTLTNLGHDAVSSAGIFVSAAGFDSSGVLVGVGEGIPTEDVTLAVGGSVPFEIIMHTLSGEPVSYQFFAEILNLAE